MQFTNQQLRQTAFAVAYRILGDAADAEDIAQNCALKFLSVNWQTINNPQAFTATMSARETLNTLRKTQTRQIHDAKYSLPLPQITSLPESVHARLDLSYGIIMLTQKLPPLSRAVFILRSAFDMSFDEIANALERTPATCRKAHSRGKKMLETHQDAKPKQPVSTSIINQLSASIVAGDIPKLTKLLAEDIVFYSDGGGIAPDLGKPITGITRIAQFLSVSPQLLGADTIFNVIPTAQGSLLMAKNNQQLQLLVMADMAGDKITNIYAISDPKKLAKFSQQFQI